MPLILLFLCGIANFAMHKAVLESGHPLLASAGWFFEALGGRLSLIIEFLLLLGTMVMAGDGGIGWVLGYALYTALNGVSAWAILGGRL